MKQYTLTLLLIVAVALLVSPTRSPAANDGLGLRQQIQELASTNQIVVEDLEFIGNEPARVLRGNVKNKLKTLLDNYNYVLYYEPDGTISKVAISSRKVGPATAADELVVSTRRLGTHHIVDAVLSGPNTVGIPVSLLLDTGASTVVLPESMIARLGFTELQLFSQEVTTANGNLTARLGTLSSIILGDQSFNDIVVTFLPDAQLGPNMLLGMSFLERFRLTIDDRGNQIILRQH